MNQGLDLDLHLVSLVITGDVCQAEKKSGTLSDQESQLNSYRAKKFWMVGVISGEDFRSSRKESLSMKWSSVKRMKCWGMKRSLLS